MTNSDVQIPLDVLQKAYGASNHEDLRRKLLIESKGGCYVVDGIKINSFYEAANHAHLANPNKPTIPDGHWVPSDRSGPKKKMVGASAIEILLWFWPW